MHLRTVALIRTAVESLDFKFSDIKSRSPATRVATYAEGTAMIKELTGAKIIVMVGQGLVCCRLASLNRAPGVIANTE